MYTCSIWGPTCDGLDRIVEQCDLPELQVGDWLVFENMGAYTVAASSTFNGFQRPDLHYVMSRHAWYVLLRVFPPSVSLRLPGSRRWFWMTSDAFLCFLLLSYRQYVQQISSQGLLAPAEESCPFEVPAFCGLESGMDVPAKPCQAHVI